MPKKSYLIAAVFIAATILSACTPLQKTSTPEQPNESGIVAIENSPGPNDDSPIMYEFMATASGTRAIDLVDQAADIQTKDYGSAGQFVTAINGIEADNQHYWAFYHNEEYAQQGVSQTILQEGDTIRFTYEEIEQ